MLAVSVITVPAGVPAFTVTTTGKAGSSGAKLGFVQVIVPALRLQEACTPPDWYRAQGHEAVFGE